jgi:NADPH-dependent ferric siderophore reductase
MTVLIYVNTSKQVGDSEHVKVFANTDAAEPGSRRTIRKAWPLSMRFWNERGRQLRRPYSIRQREPAFTSRSTTKRHRP